MSIMFRRERQLPLLELARMWASELSDTRPEQLLQAMMQAGLEGIYDETDDEGRPGLYRRRNADPSRLDGPIDSYTFRGELAGPPHRLMVPERFAESLIISKSAVAAFAERRGLPLPKCWAPEQPVKKQQGSGGRPPKWDWEAFWLELAARVHERGLPPTDAELVRQMQEWFTSQFDNSPAESELKLRISRLRRRLG